MSHSRKMLQLYRNADGSYDCHSCTIRGERDAEPTRRHYRRVSWPSVERFHAVSGGYLTAYSDKDRREEQ